MKPAVLSTILSACLAVTAIAKADSATNSAYDRDLAVWTGTGPTALGQDNATYARDLALWYSYGLPKSRKG